MKTSQKIGFSFLGFPFASFLIFIIYICTYLIEGLSAYLSEILILTNINNLLRELVVLGTSLFISIFCLLTFYDVSTEKGKTKVHSVLIVVASLLLLVVGFAFIPVFASALFLSDMTTFNLAFFVIWLVVVSIFSLIQIVKEFINRWILSRKSVNNDKSSN